MPALLMVVTDPAKVAMLLICLFGAAFMLWFLVGLYADWRRMHATYVMRFKFGEAQSDLTRRNPLCDDLPFEEASYDTLTERTSHHPVQGFRIEQRF
jgi:hypothetical protein